jgi:hypothetical protein
VIEKLKKRWNIDGTRQVLIVLLVFALTGTTVLVLKKPLFKIWFPDGEIPLGFSIMYYILIFPIYNAFLLMYGFLLGEFKFFWEFEKKFFMRMRKRFSKNTETAMNDGENTAEVI